MQKRTCYGRRAKCVYFSLLPGDQDLPQYMYHALFYPTRSCAIFFINNSTSCLPWIGFLPVFGKYGEETVVYTVCRDRKGNWKSIAKMCEREWDTYVRLLQWYILLFGGHGMPGNKFWSVAYLHWMLSNCFLKLVIFLDLQCFMIGFS